MLSVLRTTVALAMTVPVLLLPSSQPVASSTVPTEPATTVAGVALTLASQQHIPADCYGQSVFNYILGEPGLPDLDAAQRHLARWAHSMEQDLLDHPPAGEEGDADRNRLARATEIAALKALSAPSAHRSSQHGGQYLQLSARNQYGQLIAQANYGPGGSGMPDSAPQGYLLETLTRASVGSLTAEQDCTSANN